MLCADCREPPSPTVRTRYIGGCVTPPNVPRPLAPWRAATSLFPEGGARPAGRLMSLGMAAHTSCLQSFGSARSSSCAAASFCRLRGCVGRLWIVFLYFIILFLLLLYVYQDPAPPPPGLRTMAHRSHGHMCSQGEGSPLVIYIYIYNNKYNPQLPGPPSSSSSSSPGSRLLPLLRLREELF